MQILKRIYLKGLYAHIQNLGSTEGKWGKVDLAHITYSFTQ